MIKSFQQYIIENHEEKTEFVKDLTLKLIQKLRSDKFEESLEYKKISKLEFVEPFQFDLIIYVRRDSNPNTEEDSHFGDLPWEKINFEDNGYMIDANVTINKNDLFIPEIKIHLVINPKKEPHLYSKLYARLLDILVHETNHLNQIGMDREPFNSMPSHRDVRHAAKKNYNYFLLKDEVESMVEGMYEKSKHKEIPLDHAFTEYLAPFVQSKYISLAEYEEVMQVWVKHAVEKYPDAVFSKKVEKIINSI